MDPLSPELLTTGLTINPIISIVIIVLLVILAALLAASETAFSKCNRYKIESLANDDNKAAKITLNIIENSDKTIIDTLIWINISHIVASTLATYLFISLIYDNDIASLVSTIVMTIILFFFSELLPKNIANLNPNATALFLAPFVNVLGIIIYPIAIIFRGLIKLLKKLFKVDESLNNISEDDFSDTVSEVAEEGLLEDEEMSIIQNAIDFGDTTVLKVVTPIDKVISIDYASTKEEILSFIETVNYTRIPVYKGTKDNIVGVLHIKKYLLALKDNPKLSLRSILYKPLFTNETTSLDDMVEIFQQKHNHMAFVKDSNDTIIGMITLEDVVEELVGDINEQNPPKVLLKGGRR